MKMAKSSNLCHCRVKAEQQKNPAKQLKNYGNSNYYKNNNKNSIDNDYNNFLVNIKNVFSQLTRHRRRYTRQSPARFYCNQGNEKSEISKNNNNIIHNNNNKFNKCYKLLITIILILITTMTATICESATMPTIAMMTTTTAIQIVALSLITKTTTSSIKTTTLATLFIVATSAATVAAAAQSASPQLQQQRQFQQQQLFAMLTKNGQQSANGAPGGGGGIGAGGVVDDEPAVSLETIGFVSDDGDQRYEKAEKALAAAAAAAAAAATSGNRSQHNSNNNNNNSNVDCPKECKCLNVYFECGKKHLDRVPTLPSYVQILELIGNKLNDTTVLQIRNLPELKRLSLKRNQLDTFPKFTGLTSLRQLNLAGNHIQRIPSEALAALPKLKSLDLSRNYLHTLEANYFPETIRLQHLILNNNEISSIDEHTFEHLPGLLELQLNSNRLLSLPTGVFKNLNKLTKLSLNNNHLEINFSTFKGLIAMQKLSLQSNNIRALQDGIFYMMHGIESIELDNNAITSLSRQGLFNLTKLHHLSLSNNSISRIELDTWEFTQSLVSLDLSYNNISEFKPQHLDCLQQLRQLNLGHNKIQFFADNTFDCVKNLEDLNLKRNRLAWIVEDAGATPPFKALRKLKKLDLSGNNIKQINSKSLSGLNSLEQLNLEGNALASIQSSAFEHMTRLQLKFKSMNFICDCELLWFRRWLLSKSHGKTQMQKNAICGYPDHLLDRELLTLSPGELICADSPKPVIIQEPINQLAVNGANITMECIANSPAAASLAAADELKIKWRHDNQNLRGSNSGAASTPPGPTQLHNHYHNLHHHHNHHALGNSHSYSTTETQIHHDQTTNQTTIIGYLRLYNVSYESAGRYQCVVSNAFGTTYSQKFKLSIGIHPSFLQIPSNLTIDSGGTARLVCSATGDPTPEIALQKFGASDFPAATERRLQVIREENAFVITNAKPIDTGIYTFTAKSAAGEIKIIASLIVNDKPQPDIPLIEKEVVLGSSSVLECLSDLASEFQRPHREWFKDNKPFHTSTTSASERYYFTTEKELLVVMNTQSVDAGHYRCEITDDSKTQIIQTELIVVKEQFSQNFILISVGIVAVVCVFVGSLIICAVLCYQRRKSSPQVDSHGSALDQTQLTTLNRTYLRSQNEQPLRPLSLTDLEMNDGMGIGVNGADDAEQRNCLIVVSTPSYQQQLQHPTPQSRNYDGSVDTYLRRNSLYDAEYQQDHFSSKDSGTGSDAAVKRSIDDFTMALLPLSTSTDATLTIGKSSDKPIPPGRASLARADTYTDDVDGFEANDDDDDASTPRAAGSDVELATSPVLGISAAYPETFEMTELRRNGNIASSSNASTPCGSPHEQTSNNFDGGGGGGGIARTDERHRFPHATTPISKCKQDLSTSFNANVTAPQAVDI